MKARLYGRMIMLVGVSTFTETPLMSRHSRSTRLLQNAEAEVAQARLHPEPLELTDFVASGFAPQSVVYIAAT
jgi:hypothetical protein